MISYATVTGTLKNIAVIRDHGWGWLFSAAGWLPTHEWVAKQRITDCIGDSGAWHYHLNDKPFDTDRYQKFVAWIAPLKPRFVMLPDIVGQGADSLGLSLAWEAHVRACRLRPALVVQNGMEPRDIAPLLGPDMAVCVGGTTEWKLDTMRAWGAVANEKASWLHILRVNTAKRIRLCEQAGAHSYDGTSGSIFSKSVPMLDRTRQVQDIEGFLARNPA